MWHAIAAFEAICWQAGGAMCRDECITQPIDRDHPADQNDQLKADVDQWQSTEIVQADTE